LPADFLGQVPPGSPLVPFEILNGLLQAQERFLEFEETAGT
jgi:hypothetical protein